MDVADERGRATTAEKATMSDGDTKPEMDATLVARQKAATWYCITLVCWTVPVALESTVLGVALPTISYDLHATSVQAFWFGTSFLLCSAVLQPIFVSLSTIFGRKPVLVISLTLFTVGSLICALSHHVAVLMVGRCIQGSGGGSLMAISQAVMTDEIPLQERKKVFNYAGPTWLFGAVVGPIMSGAFTEKVTWRWIFWINLPLCAIAYVVTIWGLRCSFKPEPIPIVQRFKTIDYLGAFLFTASATSFLIAISWGGTMFSWSSFRTIVPLILGVVGLIAWACYSGWLTKNPMIPIQIMKNRTASITYFSIIFQGLVQFALIYYGPLYYQAVKNYSPIISGVALLPQCILGAPANMLSAILITKYDRTKPLVLTGWILTTLGVGLLVLLEPNTSIVQWVFINFPSGIGLGLLFSGLALTVQAAAEASGTHSPEQVLKIRGSAASLTWFFRAFGQSLGVVIAQSAFTNQIRKRAGSLAGTEAASLTQIIKALPNGVERTTLVNDFNDSLHVVWWLLTGISGAMVILTMFTTDVGLGIRKSASPPDSANDEASEEAPEKGSPMRS